MRNHGENNMPLQLIIQNFVLVMEKNKLRAIHKRRLHEVAKNYPLLPCSQNVHTGSTSSPIACRVSEHIINLKKSKVFCTRSADVWIWKLSSFAKCSNWTNFLPLTADVFYGQPVMIKSMKYISRNFVDLHVFRKQERRKWLRMLYFQYFCIW